MHSLYLFSFPLTFSEPERTCRYKKLVEVLLILIYKVLIGTVATLLGGFGDFWPFLANLGQNWAAE